MPRTLLCSVADMLNTLTRSVPVSFSAPVFALDMSIICWHSYSHTHTSCWYSYQVIAMYVLVTPISELRNEATIITRGRHRDRVGKPAYRHDDFSNPIHSTACLLLSFWPGRAGSLHSNFFLSTLAIRCCGNIYICKKTGKTNHNHFTTTPRPVEGFSHEDSIFWLLSQKWKLKL